MSKSQIKLSKLWSKKAALVSERISSLSLTSAAPVHDSSSSVIVESVRGYSPSLASVDSTSDSSTEITLIDPAPGLSSSASVASVCGSLSSSITVGPIGGYSSSLTPTDSTHGSSAAASTISVGGSSSAAALIDLTPEPSSSSSSVDLSRGCSTLTTLTGNSEFETIIGSTTKQSVTSPRTNHRVQYLRKWEQTPEAQFKTYVYDDLGGRHESFTCWLYFENNAMYCLLCKKYGKRKNTNGKENVWCTSGMKTLSLDKIKQHKENNEVHKQAEDQEILVSSRSQPGWHVTKQKEVGKQEQAIQNLMFSCIFLIQQDRPLSIIEPLCSLLEKLQVQLLPAQVSGVSYRNSDAAVGFLHHIANYLHEELVEKIQSSPVIGWMLDETTSRTTEKSCIVFVRYIDNYEEKTAYYGLIDLEGNGTAKNIVQCLHCLWKKDDINISKSCWLATDNASTFTGVNEGVVAKLRRQFDCEWLELNPCAAHTFCLVGSQACYQPKVRPNESPVLCESVSNFENTISKIYNYFSRSSSRQVKFKQWQNYLEISELKFKKIFDIRWSSIQGCIKPIILNVQSGSQSLLAYLQETIVDFNLSLAERESAQDLLKCVLDDEFLFSLHFHHDFHEIVLGPLTKIMQNDKLTYFALMENVDQKRKVLENWRSLMTSAVGPALSEYIELTTAQSYGSFKLHLGDRQNFFQNCSEHVHRLVSELDRRFVRSKLQESLCTLFDPSDELDFVRQKYKNLPGFDSHIVRHEWESLKQPLNDYTNNFGTAHSIRTFWKDFIALQATTNSHFFDEYKNILLLLNIYFIAPTNSAECERGFSAANRIQTIGRSRLEISTLDVLMTMRMLLKDDIRSSRCQQIVTKAFESWNDRDQNRRLHQVQLLLDVPDDYTPDKQVRSFSKRHREDLELQMMHNKKKKKSKYIKCANGCKREVSGTDPNQNEAIQCCHQTELFRWIDSDENCSRWLCNYCRIKLGINIYLNWFCEDHIDMHHEDDEIDNEKENFH